MPKVPTKSTDRRKARLLRIREMDHAMAQPCQRCDSKGLKCLLSLEGNCLECVAATVSCSLFPSEEDFAAVRRRKQELRREIRELEKRRLDIERQRLEVEDRLDGVDEEEKRLFDREKNSIVELERLEAAQEKPNASSSTVPAVKPVALDPTDPGWLQADSSLLLNPSFEFSDLFDIAGFDGTALGVDGSV